MNELDYQKIEILTIVKKDEPFLPVDKLVKKVNDIYNGLLDDTSNTVSETVEPEKQLLQE